MLLGDKEKELAIIVAKDLTAVLLRDPERHKARGKGEAVQIFGEVLDGVALAIKNLGSNLQTKS